MGPRAPGTPKKGWNCIGFIRPGASGPRGCGKLDFCKFRNNFSYIFDGNMEFHIKMKFQEIQPFCASQNPCANQSFLDGSSRYPIHFQGIPLILPKYAEFRYFQHFGCPEVTFWPRIGLLGARLRNLYKRKLVGGFLEAPSRKSAFWTKKVGNFSPTPDFHEKALFAQKMALDENLKCSRNLTISALKNYLNNKIRSFTGPLAPKWLNLVKFTKFLEISGNFTKFKEIIGISAFLRKRAIRAEMTKIHLKQLYNSCVLERGRKTVPVFAEIMKFLRIAEKSEIPANFTNFSKIH